MAVVSKEKSLRKEDYKKWFHNLKKFLVPLAILYLVSVISKFEGGVIFNIEYLRPTDPVIGAMILYIFNGLLDLLTKWSHENKY